jgi:di/tricarboxylate transporter
LVPFCTVVQLFTIFLSIEIFGLRKAKCLRFFRQRRTLRRKSKLVLSSLAINNNTDALSEDIEQLEGGEILVKFGKEIPPWSRKDITVIVIVLCTVVLWAAESASFFTKHNFNTVYIAILAVLCLHFPSIGPCYIADRNANMRLCIFVIAVLALGGAYNSPQVADISNIIQEYLSSFLKLSDNTFVKYYMAYLFTTVSIWISSTGPCSGILVPQLIQIAKQVNLNRFVISLLLPMGACTLIFPSQSPPCLVAFQLGRVSKPDFLKVLLFNSFLFMIFVAPLCILYMMAISKNIGL